MTPQDFIHGLQAVLEAAKAGLTPAPDGFSLVVIPDAGHASVESFDEITAMVARAGQLSRQPGTVTVAYVGQPLRVSGRAGNRLLHFAGTTYPLQQAVMDEVDSFFVTGEAYGDEPLEGLDDTATLDAEPDDLDPDED